MKRYQSVWILLLSLFTTGLPTAHAHEIGNGGGAWVCREPGGDLRWVNLIDLFEAQSEFSLSLAKTSGSYTEIADQMQARLVKVDKDLSDAVGAAIGRIGYLKENPPSVEYTKDTLQIIDDSLYRLMPSVSRCAGGLLVANPLGGEKIIPYEQVINYKNDGDILVQSDLFKRLPEVEKAAAVFHEAIYAYRRTAMGDTSSVITRRIVGLIFSDLSEAELKKQLSAIGESESVAATMTFAPIQPGTFTMSALAEDLPVDEPGHVYTEVPHQVTLTHGFEVQTTNVTQEQWFKVMGANPASYTGKNNCPDHWVSPDQNGGVAMCPNLPVDTVSWNDIQSFLSRLNASVRDGSVYRLPTEAEWEYAARAGSSTAYFYGDDRTQLGNYAWYSGNSGGQPHEAGHFRANAFGLYDMYGNVGQWVADVYGDLGSASVTDPTGPASGEWRAFRDGTWGKSAEYLRAAYRVGYAPSARFGDIGFRLARNSTRSGVKATDVFNEAKLGVEAKFILLKGGQYQEGSPGNEPGRVSDETLHSVTITHDFEIQATDITQQQWVAVMGSNPSGFQTKDACPDYQELGKVHLCPTNPVEQVSWNDAQEFLKRVNTLFSSDQHTYRLASEAEWEYAARAGTQTPYSFGRDASDLKDYAWYADNSGGVSHPVAAKKPNAWGLYDMNGNVWQWAEDWYGAYPADAVIDPQGQANGSCRVVRGGGMGAAGGELRSAFRKCLSPGTSGAPPYVSFRVVRVAK